MTKKESLKLFNDKKVRTVWDDEQEKWYFSVVDVIDILTDSPDPKRYWSVLKSRIKKEGLEPTTICSTLKLRATDGKMRLTDVAETEQLFRIIQSVPSLKPIVCTFIYENPKNIYPRYNGMSCVIYNFIYHYQYV